MRSYIHNLLVIAGAVVILSALVGTASAQSAQQSGSKKAPRVTLGDSEGTPGDAAVVPIYFATGEGVEVGELKLEVKFVSRNVKYSRVTKGLAAESGNVDIHAEAKDSKDDKGLEITTLTISASISDPKPGQKGIPGGLLGYISLSINATAGPADITLHNTAEATELGTKKPVQNLEAVDAQLQVLANGSEPLYSCFFFSH